MIGRFLSVAAIGAMLGASGCATPPAAEPVKAAAQPAAAVPQPAAPAPQAGSKNEAELAREVAELKALVAKLAAATPTPGEPVPVIGVPNNKPDGWKCVKVDKGPSIDGKLDDEAWKKAVQVKLVSDDDPPKKILNDTGVLICHDAVNLYLGAVCMEQSMDKLKVDCTERDQKVYGDDCIEFYLDPELDRTDAVKFVVNPNGVFMDFLRDTSGDAGDVTWNAQVKTTKEKDRYFLEIAIPLKDMGVKYKPGLSIGFNAFRMRQGNGKTAESSTWIGGCNGIATLGKVTLE